MITIEDDYVVLTGESVITAETQNSVIRYIVFTASSISNTSELSVDITPDSVSWNVSVTLVKCVKDESGKTYAIRIECPFFLVEHPEETVRMVKIDGVIYTSNPQVYSPVHETFTMTGCVDWNV